MTKASAFDYIIIGSGSAGSTLAGRLSEDPGVSVLLIEAGPRDKSIYIQMPAALGVPLTSDRFNWYYHSEPDPHIENRRIYEARGRVLGGSSSINGMNWVRGNPWDYDNWASQGLPGWSYAECLPYFKRAETFHKGADTYRGGSGPMMIETCPAEGELFQAFLEAGVQAGHGRVDDHNAFSQEGMHITQRNVHKGIRWSTSRAYLHQAGPRSNLTVLTDTRVTGIELSNKRAVRLQCVSKGGASSFEVGRELVIAAGSINSPQLLLLSGIGDADDLKKLSIPVRIHLPGVGRNLTDHVAASVQYLAKGNVSLAGQLGSFGRAKIAAQWLLFKNGTGTTNFFETGAFIRTDDSIKVPNHPIRVHPGRRRFPAWQPRPHQRLPIFLRFDAPHQPRAGVDRQRRSHGRAEIRLQLSRHRGGPARGRGRRQDHAPYRGPVRLEQISRPGSDPRPRRRER